MVGKEREKYTKVFYDTAESTAKAIISTQRYSNYHFHHSAYNTTHIHRHAHTHRHTPAHTRTHTHTSPINRLMCFGAVLITFSL